MWSNYGLDSASQLSDAQLSEAINNITGQAQGYTRYVSPEIKKLRSEILTLLTRRPEAVDAKKRGLGVPNDWDYLNPFIAQYTGGRLLNDKSMKTEELVQLKRQLLAMRAKGWMWQPKIQETAEIKEMPIIMRGMALPS